jgi:hypothetical protein
MHLRRTVVVAALMLFGATRVHAQEFTTEFVDRFVKALEAERAETDKVGEQLKALDEKIAKFHECSELMKDAGGLGGAKLGFAAKAAMKAKCGATSDEGMLRERAKLLEGPEMVGAKAAGFKPGDYAMVKERAIGFLGGDRSFNPGEIAALKARATDLSRLLGYAFSPETSGGVAGGGGVGSRLGNAVGNALGNTLRAFTPDMTWAYLMYIWGITYMSGATLFETPYKSGQWTRWEIVDASQPDTKTVLERALITRETDGSEWWRTKTISITPQSSDTIVFESLYKPIDELTMNVVRMRAKMPGETEGKELMVPENMSTLTHGAWTAKPTKESLAGATIGTESIKTNAGTFSAKHVKFGNMGGNIEWWLADNAPGGLVKVKWSGQDKDQQWTMDMVDAGTGAKSELGVK